MPSIPETTLAPRFTAPALTDLREGDALDLEDAADLDGFGFTDLRVDALALRSARLEGVRLDGIRADEADLRAVTITESELTALDIPVVRGARGRWRDVVVERGRLGSAELYESEWRSVRVVGCKLGFVNLRGADLRDVAFVDCVIDELDLTQARILRMSLPGTRIHRLDVGRMSAQHLDLRGASFDDIAGLDALAGTTIDEGQLALLAPLLAASVGIRVAG